MPHYCPVSAHAEWNLDGLLEMVWEYLDLVRIYTKPKGLNPDYNGASRSAEPRTQPFEKGSQCGDVLLSPAPPEPVIVSRSKSTVEGFCDRIHKLMIKNFKCAARPLARPPAAQPEPERGSIPQVCACLGNVSKAPATARGAGAPAGR